MFETRVALRAPLRRDQGVELERRLFFVSADILDFSLVQDDEGVHGIVVASAAPLNAEELAAKVHHVIESDIAGGVAPLRKVVWESGERAARHPGVFADLLAAGWAFEAGPGQVALGGPLLALVDHLDDLVTGAVRARFPAVEEYRYPTLLPTRVLEDVGYFTSFPQFLMLVTRLHEDADVYRSVVDDFTGGARADASLLSRCGDLDQSLPPTMCFHTFHQLRGEVFGDGENRVVTAKGKSFRYESRYATSLERLWDFTIREVVFLGTRDFVRRARADLMRDAYALTDRLGLTGFCEVATDPFFANTDTRTKVFSQRLLELKYELRADVAEDRSIAVASFNYHDSFFSECVGITDTRGGPIASACAGFGLERLLHAFLCQYGADPAGWPAEVRTAVGSAA